VVRRIFEMCAAGDGDLRIVNALRVGDVPASGKVGWSKNLVADVLANETYKGVVVYGKTRSVDRGGSAGKRVSVPAAEWERTDAPGLRIVSDELWDRVAKRKAAARSQYLRDGKGRLLGKPEGAGDLHLLNTIARCGGCGGPLSVMKEGEGRRLFYYCTARLHRGACDVGRGVPAVELDEAVRESLHFMLMGDQGAVADLMEARVAELRRQHEAQARERGNAEAEAQRLEAEIARLVSAVAAGGSADIVTAINQRRVKVEELRARPAAPPPFDRAEFLEGCRTAGGAWCATPLLNRTDPRLGRQVLRKLGIGKIVVTSDGQGWTFDGFADLGRLVADGVTEGAVEAPSD